MTNPWLEIPLADYEGHMASAHIGQARLLGQVFARILRETMPRSVAVAGCAGGNGFEQIAPETTRRVVAIDLNPAYVETVGQRFQGRFETLEAVAADVTSEALRLRPVDLMFAALIFEYVELEPALATMGRLVRPQGVLATLVQMPADHAVSPSAFPSLQKLAPLLRLVPPETLHDLAAAQGFTRYDSRRETADGGKRFTLQLFRKL